MDGVNGFSGVMMMMVMTSRWRFCALCIFLSMYFSGDGREIVELDVDALMLMDIHIVVDCWPTICLVCVEVGT